MNTRWALRALQACATAVLLNGCASNPTARFEDDGDALAHGYVASAQHFRFLTAYNADYLHRLQIADADGLRRSLEKSVGLDIPVLWSVINNPTTSAKDRKDAYALVRLIAIQNEKFPVPGWTEESGVREIFEVAIADDPEHAARLRRQDWSKPHWVKWVD